jgi:O-acetylhomoserine/O-acetylserine sulfhydrylase-like pyridoxal-dependent enzyme
LGTYGPQLKKPVAKDAALSVGLEDVEDLIADLDQALET